MRGRQAGRPQSQWTTGKKQRAIGTCCQWLQQCVLQRRRQQPPPFCGVVLAFSSTEGKQTPLFDIVSVMSAGRIHRNGHVGRSRHGCGIRRLPLIPVSLSQSGQAGGRVDIVGREPAPLARVMAGRPPCATAVRTSGRHRSVRPLAKRVKSTCLTPHNALSSATSHTPHTVDTPPLAFTCAKRRSTR